MIYRLIILWDSEPDEIREEYTYKTRQAAEQAMANVRKAFGHQMEWMGIREETR